MIKKSISIFFLSLLLLSMIGLVNAQINPADIQDQMEESQRQFDEQYEANIEMIANARNVANTGMKLSVIILVFVWVLAIASLVAFIWALVNILGADNDSGWKILWVVVCFFLGLLGVIIYLFIGMKSRIKGVVPTTQASPQQEQSAAEKPAQEAKVKFCSSCGAKLEAGVSFCSGCGEKQS